MMPMEDQSPDAQLNMRRLQQPGQPQPMMPPPSSRFNAEPDDPATTGFAGSMPSNAPPSPQTGNPGAPSQPSRSMPSQESSAPASNTYGGAENSYGGRGGAMPMMPPPMQAAEPAQMSQRTMSPDAQMPNASDPNQRPQYMRQMGQAPNSYGGRGGTPAGPQRARPMMPAPPTGLTQQTAGRPMQPNRRPTPMGG